MVVCWIISCASISLSSLRRIFDIDRDTVISLVHWDLGIVLIMLISQLRRIRAPSYFPLGVAGSVFVCVFAVVAKIRFATSARVVCLATHFRRFNSLFLSRLC